MRAFEDTFGILFVPLIVFLIGYSCAKRGAKQNQNRIPEEASPKPVPPVQGALATVKSDKAQVPSTKPTAKGIDLESEKTCVCPSKRSRKSPRSRSKKSPAKQKDESKKKPAKTGPVKIVTSLEQTQISAGTIKKSEVQPQPKRLKTAKNDDEDSDNCINPPVAELDVDKTQDSNDRVVHDDDDTNDNEDDIMKKDKNLSE
ncbi:unnamed protein product [Bursaphelenchus xylophilus]|uniref:(pine wood nematode) hypothetical protein n=1 Tax=Bursaphelenchus xylophilus TaxID=6326 RepID=A0A1I7SL67_BURXY|nr:unnamed protein product [Bursaphelenchus xylophilus]CAG9129386.1 unnamed protein product [Bursaphelenchus xylophilus]